MLGILPEIILAVWGLLILAVDFCLPRAVEKEESDRRNLKFTGLAITGLLLAWFGIYAARHGAPPWWAQTQIAVDPFGTFFKVLIVLTAILVILLTPHYVMQRIPHAQGEFYALLIFAALGMFLMSSAIDLITLYVALEFTSICIYILAGYMKRDPKSAEAGIKVFLIGVISSGVMLYGMSLLYGAVGSTQLTEIREALGGRGDPLFYLALILVLTGFAFKLAIVPFHQWMPDTFEGAPTPFVAYLAVAPKAAGFAMVLRVFSTAFGDLEKDWAFWMAIIATLTMTVGNLAAIPQTNFKRMLAYSSIAHAGYMVIGLAAYNMEHQDMAWMRMSGILIYLVTYVFMNVGAFGVALLVSQATGSDDIAAARWMVKRSPLAAVAFLIFAWSLAGLPPTAGFIGKYFLFSAALDSGLVWLALVGVINSVISVFYYFNVVRIMFFPPLPPGERAGAPPEPTPIAAPRPLEWALVLCVIGTLVIGVYPQPLIDLAQRSLLNVAAMASVLPLLKGMA